MKLIVFYCVVILICLVTANPNLQLTKTQSRIINGRRATLGMFPFQALITVINPYNTYPCGGSLIHPRWVVTSAQCTQGANSFTVQLGTLTPDKGLFITSNFSITHEEYNKPPNVNNGKHDIGLIKLDFAPVLSDTIQIIKLLPDNSRVLNKLQISGWGATSNDPNWSLAPVLQYADVTQISFAECARTYPFLTANTACTRGSPEDPSQSSCDGDGGGPVVLRGTTSDNTFLVGIISFGSDKGCTAGLPVGHTRIVPYLNWIYHRTFVTAGR